MNQILRSLILALFVVGSVASCGDNHHQHVTIMLFEAAPDAIETGQSTKLIFLVEPADATLTITGIGDVSHKVQTPITPAATTTYDLTAAKDGETATATVTVTVGPSHGAGLRLESANPTPAAGEAFPVTITALAGDASVAPGYRGTVHLTSSDGQAVLPADVTFDAVDAGVKQVMVTLKTAGLETLTGVDTVNTGTQGATTVTVQGAAAAAFTLSALPATAIAGDALVLSITARDAFGNVATTYTGQAHVASTDATDVLPADGAFTAGVRIVSVAFTKVGTHFATVSEVGGSIPSVNSSNVAIGAAAPFRIDISSTSLVATAGVAKPFTVSLFDRYDNACANYVGTVHFTNTDAQAVLPADYTFAAADAGVHDFTATLKTAGLETLTMSDTVATAINGSASWLVDADVPTSCIATHAPASATAGAAIGMTVIASDAYGNLATTYTGTMVVLSSDPRASLPPPATYTAADAGSHAFSAALLTTGTQTLTATDVMNNTVTCSASIVVTPAAPKLVVTLPGSANAGYAATVGLVVKDIYDNAFLNYAGTVTFSNTDGGTGATTPAPITFTGTEGGVATTSATFVTIGTQTLAATDGTATGSAQLAVHGLVYTAPATGRVRLVVNAANSNTQTVQLDLVANELLEVSNFFGGGPGSFAAGMNLPLDTTRVGPDATLFTPGAALPAGTGTRAAGAAIGATDHVLYTVVSRKRIAGSNFNQETQVAAGAVFYSVRLKLTPAGGVGAVFDGAQPGPLFRAAVRDQYGDDFVGQSDFGIGKLEIR